MNLLTAIKKDSVEYDSATSTCASDVDVHTKMTPQAFPVVRLFTDPTMGSGPNRSTAVEKNGGDGPILCSGRGAIFCSPNLLADLLHAKHAFFTALAFGLRDPHLGPAPHDHRVDSCVVYFVGFF